jgi:signal transduction histidine kinase/ActR/RegA family two-component response regulator
MTQQAVASRLQAIARTGALFVVGLSGVVLVGWIFGVPVLTSVVPGFASMAVPTALCFSLSGVSLFLLASPLWIDRRIVARKLFAAAVLLIGIYAFIFYALTAQLSFTRADPDSGYIFGHAMGRMAPATAFCFILIAAALLLGRSASAGKVFAGLAAIGLVVAGLDLVGYIYQVQALYKVMPFSAMSLPSATAFVVLLISALLARPFDGWTGRIVADDSGGLASRRLLPAVIAIPVLFAWLIEKANERAIFDAPFGFALLAVATVVVLEIIVVRMAAWLAQRDRELRMENALRREAQDKLQMQLARLNLLGQITRAIGDRLDLKSILQIVIRSLEEQLPVDFSCFCLYDSVQNVMTVNNVGIKSRPLASELALPEDATFPIDKNGLSRCIEGELVHEPDIHGIEFPFPQRLAGAGLRALVMSPLIIEGAVFGILVIARRQADSFTSSDCEFMKQLSEHVALAIHQAELHNSLKQAYDDLHQTQKAVMQQERLRALGQMASGIAHDINNAISPMSIYTEYLLEDEPDLSDATRKYLEMVKRVVNDISATVARMGEFYRQREAQVELAPIDLNELAQQAIDLTRARWSDMPQQRGIVIAMHTVFAPGLPRAMGIDNEIREALTNLIFNAVDALPNGGAITILTGTDSTAAGRIRLEIADTGIGMNEETKRRALEPFFTTKGERGTGLGLAMVYGIMQRHGAEIEIDSTVGVGTAMRFVFQQAADTIGPQQPAFAGKSPALAILLIDDDPFILDSMRMILERDGHSVTLAEGGETGINTFKAAQARGTPFEIVFTDLGMPHIDGRQVARTIRKLSPAAKIVLLSGWGQRLAGRETESDFDCVLGKPPKLSELREALVYCASRLERGVAASPVARMANR